MLTTEAESFQLSSQLLFRYHTYNMNEKIVEVNILPEEQEIIQLLAQSVDHRRNT